MKDRGQKTDNRRQNLLALVGPTACGKTDVAFKIAKNLPIEIISCDSMQVYDGMSILTQAVIPDSTGPAVRLASFLDLSKEYSAACFRTDALGFIQQILKAKKIPLIVGGTGLYLRALLDGLFETEPGQTSKDDRIRKKLSTQQDEHGGDYLHRKLQKTDPASALKIHPHDIRRIIRALEVYELTGKPLSEQKIHREGIRDKFQCRIFFLERDRRDLYERIDRRVERMREEGLLEEVRRILKKDLSQTARMALGIREMEGHLKGTLTLSAAIELLKKNTRNYAKRQIAWFRHEQGVETISVAPEDSAIKIADEILRRL